MKLSRRVSWFLLLSGAWCWFVWITFAKNLWQDSNRLAFDEAGHPTGYFWVHLVLIIVSMVLGTGVGAVGIAGVRASARGLSGGSEPQRADHMGHERQKQPK